MRVIVISDPHVTGQGQLLCGVDTGDRLMRIVAHINADRAMGDFCILLGDLVNRGTVAEYQRLHAILAGLDRPWVVILGNHDNRSNFQTVFGNGSNDSNGFVQFAMEMAGCRLMFLDTHEAGQDYGVLCRRRLAWIETTLARKPCVPTYLFMHHPPHRLSVGADRNRLVNPWELGQLILGYPQVRGIFAGHVHLQSSGHWLGVPTTTFASPYRNRRYGRRGADGQEVRDLDSQFLGVIDFAPDQVVVHSIEMPIPPAPAPPL